MVLNWCNIRTIITQEFPKCTTYTVKYYILAGRTRCDLRHKFISQDFSHARFLLLHVSLSFSVRGAMSRDWQLTMNIQLKIARSRRFQTCLTCVESREVPSLSQLKAALLLTAAGSGGGREQAAKGAEGGE